MPNSELSNEVNVDSEHGALRAEGVEPIGDMPEHPPVSAPAGRDPGVNPALVPAGLTGAGNRPRALAVPLAAALALTGAPAMALPSPIAGQNYAPTFYDNFARGDWDQDPSANGTTKWWNWVQCCMTTSNKTSTQAYPDSVSVDPYAIGVNGTHSGLNIRLIEKDDTWVTGILSSENSSGAKGFSQTYGYFDIEARMSAGPATWPAFSLQSVGNSGNEIDLEFYGSTPTWIYYALHNKSCEVDCYIAASQDYDLPDMTAGFHNYGLLWTPTTISFYFDNQLRWSTPTPSSFDVPMEMVLDNGIGNGQPTPGQASGADFQIEYVEVSKERPEIAASALTTGQQTASSVPERSTWAMMLSGFAVLGLAGWRATRSPAKRAGEL